MSVDYQEKYKFLKRKLKILVYEHEALTQELEKSQRKLLKVARDKSFLLDRLLQYEQVILDSPRDSDATLSSDSDCGEPPQTKRKLDSAKIVKSEPVDKVDQISVTPVEPTKEQGFPKPETMEIMTDGRADTSTLLPSISQDHIEVNEQTDSMIPLTEVQPN